MSTQYLPLRVRLELHTIPPYLLIVEGAIIDQGGCCPLVLVMLVIMERVGHVEALLSASVVRGEWLGKGRDKLRPGR